MKTRVDILDMREKVEIVSWAGNNGEFRENEKLARSAAKHGLRILVEAAETVTSCADSDGKWNEHTSFSVEDGGKPVLVKNGKTVASGWTKIRAKIEAVETGDVMKPGKDKPKRRGP